MVSQEHHIECKLLMHISWVDVHDFGEPNQDRIPIIVYGWGHINDIRNAFDIVIGPGITLLILIYHEDSLELRTILVEEVKRYLDWAVITVVDFYLFIVLMVREL